MMEQFKLFLKKHGYANAVKPDDNRDAYPECTEKCDICEKRSDWILIYAYKYNPEKIGGKEYFNHRICLKCADTLWPEDSQSLTTHTTPSTSVDGV